MKNKWRYNIRLAERKGITIRQGTAADLPLFYGMYAVTAAQIRRMAVVEHGDGPAARDIRALWTRVRGELA